MKALYNNNNYKIVVGEHGKYDVINIKTGVVEATMEELPNALSAMHGLNEALSDMLEKLLIDEADDSLILH